MAPKNKERIHCKRCNDEFTTKLPITELGRYCKKCYKIVKKEKEKEFIKNNMLEENEMFRKKKKEEEPLEIEEAVEETIDEEPPEKSPPKLIPELGPPAATLTCDHCKQEFHVYDHRKKSRRWCFKCAPTPADSNRLGAIHGPRKQYKPRATKPAGVMKSDDIWYRARYESLCKDLEKIIKEHGMVIKQKIEHKHIAPYLNKVEETVKEIVEKTFGLMGLEMLKKIDWEEEWKAIDKL